MKKSSAVLRKAARGVKLVILDVDGVLTDGGIIMDNTGNEFKRFHVRDGHGIKLLMAAGIQVALITGRYSKVVEFRAKDLGITEVYQRCHIKSVAFEDLIGKLGIKESETAYVGDDIVDIPILRRVGFPVVVADGAVEAKAVSAYVTKTKGGYGAVREVAEFILKAKGLWNGIIKEHSEI